MTTATSTLPDARTLDALAVAAQSGREDAVADLLGALLSRLRPLVAHRIRAGRGSLRNVDVDDLAQDLVIIIWQRDLPDFDPSRSGFLTFVNRRISWHLAECARTARRHTGVVLDDAELESVEDLGRDPVSLLDRVANEKQLLEIPTVIHTFPTDNDAREVIVRHDFEGATLTVIAKEMQINVSNVCRARKRGIRHLARHMGALAA